MLVLDHAKMGKVAFLITRTDNRNFFFKINKRFEYRVGTIQPGESRFDIPLSLDLRLPFTVIAKAGGF